MMLIIIINIGSTGLMGTIFLKQDVHSLLNMNLIPWVGKFYLLAVFIALMFSTIYCDSFKREKPRESYANFVRNPFKRLVASSLTTVQISSIGECTLKCVNHQECVSVNFGNQGQGKHTCKLINTDRFKQPDKFTASQNFHHYNIKVSWGLIRHLA